MATWCFVCDAPVEGDRCPTCGRLPTVVDDGDPGPPPTPPWWTRVPRRTWAMVGAGAVVLLYTLFQSGFRLLD